MVYEHTPIIAVANAGFNTNFLNGKSNFTYFFKTLNTIVNATAWQATEAHAAPFTPIDGIGTKIKFNINLTITPASEWNGWYF